MSARDVVASDSEAEQMVTKKHQSKKEATPSEEEPQGEQQADGEEQDEGDEEEYEIEAILDAKKGTFGNGRFGFLVKWKGYDQSHNSWVDEIDAGNATDLIEQYWQGQKRRKSASKAKSAEPRSEGKKKRGRPSRGRGESTDQDVMNVDESDAERATTTKRARKTATTTTTTTTKKKRNAPSSEPDEISADSLISMEKWRNLDSWEDLVYNIDTIEREGGTDLAVYFTLTTGEHTKQLSSVCSEKFPKKMLKFYEAHLRWKDAGEPHSD